MAKRTKEENEREQERLNAKYGFPGNFMHGKNRFMDTKNVKRLKALLKELRSKEQTQDIENQIKEAKEELFWEMSKPNW